MGLDIMVYECVELVKEMTVEECNDSDWDETDGLTYLYHSWPERTDGMADGIYRFSGKVEGFRAGSYGGYNAWRNMLSRFGLGMSDEMVWIQRAQGPFSELVNFADNEGFIGPKTSAKLAKDFRDHLSRARGAMVKADDGHWLDKYEEWMSAFELAAGTGVVKFH